jgi:hypothetical protein
MIKAPLTAYQATLRARMITGACVLAHQHAIKGVKEQLRWRGIRVSEFTHRELAIMADEYLARNPELLNEAATLVERWRAEGFFGKRAQRCFVQPLQLANPGPIQNPLRAAS